MIRFSLNNKPVEIDVDPNMPLLWALRDILGMTVALLNEHPNPDDETIDNYKQGNICRCGTYPRIKAAIKSAAKSSQTSFNYTLGKNVGGQA